MEEHIDYTIGDTITVISRPDLKDTSTAGTLKEGETYTCEGLVRGCIHHPIIVDIGNKTTKNVGCFKCNKVFSSSIFYADARYFKKVDTLVNIDELTEILENKTYS